MKNMLMIALLGLSACTWVTYDDHGSTRWKQKYPTGTSVYYQDGSYDHNHRYNQYRPVQRAVE